jgi:hypothetical protein
MNPDTSSKAQGEHLSPSAKKRGRGFAVIPHSDAAIIRQRFASGETWRSIGESYGVRWSSVKTFMLRAAIREARGGGRKHIKTALEQGIDFLNKRISKQENGCWLWTGDISRAGYGRFKDNGKQIPAHRAVYEAYVGPIPQGLVIDHLCRVHACVNPQHLEPVTNKENILRGIAPAAKYSKQTACKYGHTYTPETTYWYSYGPNGKTRKCRVCARRVSASRYQKLKSKSPNQQNAGGKNG